MPIENKLAGFLFEATGVEKYRKFLDVTSVRHKLISSNVANVSTPGYEAQDIDFRTELKKLSNQSNRIAGSTTHSSHIPLGQHAARAPEINRTRVGRQELNSVDIDQEVPKMAQNELQFTIGAKLLQKKFDGLQKVITSR